MRLSSFIGLSHGQTPVRAARQRAGRSELLRQRGEHLPASNPSLPKAGSHAVTRSWELGSLLLFLPSPSSNCSLLQIVRGNVQKPELRPIITCIATLLHRFIRPAFHSTRQYGIRDTRQLCLPFQYSCAILIGTPSLLSPNQLSVTRLPSTFRRFCAVSRSVPLVKAACVTVEQ